MRAFLNLVYPLTCPICGVRLDEEKGLCKDCIAKIPKNLYGIAACRFEGVIKEAVHLFKYKGMVSLLNTFSAIILEFIERNIDMKKIDAIVPIPLHPVKLRERGFNQAYLLSLSIAKRYNIPISTGNLIKTKATRPQSTLGRNQRLKNLKGAFSVKRSERLKGKSVLLVDDVYTTGTTIDNAAEALKKAGIKNIKAMILANGA